MKRDPLAGRVSRFLLCLLPIACSLSSCAAHAPFAVPEGNGLPAPQGAVAWTEASEACRGVRSLSVELHIAGHAGLQRLRSTTLQGAVTSGDQIYFVMPVPFGAPGFVLAGTGDRATLLLPRDKRVLYAPADDIVEALVGLKLGPKQLLPMLAGCVDQSPDVSAPAAFGALIAVATPNARVFLHRDAGGWRVAAAATGSLVIEYQRYEGAWPSQVRISSAPGRAPQIDVSLSLNQIEINGPLESSVFLVAVPADAAPLSLQQLKDAGPLGEKR